MVSERMLMPPWAREAARKLSDQQLSLSQEPKPTVVISPHRSAPLLFPDDESKEDGGELVAGTVSRKGKFGFTCESCSWVPMKGDPVDWVQGMKSYTGLHFPDRCKKCRSRMKRWTCAARNYDKLELLRQLEGRHCLRFVTLTKEEWNIKVPATAPSHLATLAVETPRGRPGFELCSNTSSHLWNVKVPVGSISDASSQSSPPTLWGEAEKLKKKAVKQFRNWRTRNKYWISREAKGQAFYECTMKPVWNGWGWDEVQLHFHIHMVVCSKRIENKDIQFDPETLEYIPMSTTIQREWGGIVDVRKCKTWKHKDGETKTSKRFVMNYLVDYINKSPHWQSTKFGDWSS